MALEPLGPTGPTRAAEWTFPMHPEILRDAPGTCPICGMALEPRAVTAGEDQANPELRDMMRRFGLATAFTVPLLAASERRQAKPEVAMFYHGCAHDSSGVHVGQESVTLLTMDEIRIESVSPPLDRPDVVDPLAATLRLVHAMGLLQSTGGPVKKLDLPTLRRLLTPVREEGIAASAFDELSSMKPAGAKRGRLASILDRLHGALVESPTPRHEWPRLADVLGLELLARLVGTSTASARRYASGERYTPEVLADRLHHIAMIVADLAGAYNDLGIRLWFDRPRQLLAGKRPRDLLAADWRPGERGPQRVLELAASLVGSPAT